MTGLVYGLRAYGPTRRARASASIRTSCCSTPTPRDRRRAPLAGRSTTASARGPPRMAPARFDTRDNAAHALKARVVPRRRPPPGDRRPPRAVADLVLYEVHVRASMLHPGIPPALRGSYAGMAHPASIAHFKRLGRHPVAAAGALRTWTSPPGAAGDQLLGLQQPRVLLPRPAPRPGRPPARPEPAVNAASSAPWSMRCTPPASRWSSTWSTTTPEGNELGPDALASGAGQPRGTASLPDDPSCYENHRLRQHAEPDHPRVTQFVLDSLRYWVEVMGVDGFRFDPRPRWAARRSALTRRRPSSARSPGPGAGRRPPDCRALGPGPDGYQVGRFPAASWSGTTSSATPCAATGCRSGARGRASWCALHGVQRLFHHGRAGPRPGQLHRRARRLHPARRHQLLAQAQPRQRRGKSATAAMARSAATLAPKGPTQDPPCATRARRAQRAMLATLLLAQGTPMLAAGDEIGHSARRQQQRLPSRDNPISWLDWSAADTGTRTLSALLALRASPPAAPRAVVCRRHAPPGEAAVRWYAPSGHEMQGHDWHRTDQPPLPPSSASRTLRCRALDDRLQPRAPRAGPSCSALRPGSCC